LDGFIHNIALKEQKTTFPSILTVEEVIKYDFKPGEIHLWLTCLFVSNILFSLLAIREKKVFSVMLE